MAIFPTRSARAEDLAQGVGGSRWTRLDRIDGLAGTRPRLWTRSFAGRFRAAKIENSDHLAGVVFTWRGPGLSSSCSWLRRDLEQDLLSYKHLARSSISARSRMNETNQVKRG